MTRRTYRPEDYTRRKLPTISPFDQTETLILSETQAAPLLPRHPVGLNVRQDVNYPDVLAFVQRMGGVRAMLFHVDTGNVSRLRAFMPHVDILIWRPRQWKGERLYLDASPTEYIDRCLADLHAAGFKPGDLWIHLHNEPGWSLAMIEWERAAAEHAVSKGARVVCLNQAVGNPHESQVHMARPLLKLAGEHPENVICGLHEYFSVWGNRTYPWYVGRWQHTFLENGAPSRTMHSFESYRRSVKELKDKPVRYLVTEWGADHISDDEPYTNTLPVSQSQSISGVHTLSAVWQRDYNKPINPLQGTYPGLDTAYFQQLRIAWEHGQYDDDAMIGALIYGWGKEWPLFDISGMSQLHELLSEWRPKLTNPEPEVAEFSLPYDALLMESTNLRTEPTKDNRISKVIGTVKVEAGKDTVVTVREPVKPKEADGYSWFKVRADLPLITGTTEGWMAKHRPDLFKRIDPEPVPVEPPPPPPPPPPGEPPAPVYATVEQVKMWIGDSAEDQTEYTAAKLEALTKRILELETIVSKLVAAYGKSHVEAVDIVKELPKAS